MTSAHGKAKRKTIESIRPEVREKLNTAYTSADLFDPAGDPGLLPTAPEIKAWAEVGRVAVQGLSKLKTLTSHVENLRAVEGQFTSVSVAAGRDLPSARVAVEKFAAWQDYQGYDAWAYFTGLQKPISELAVDVVKEQRWLAWLEATMRLAQSMALAEANRNQGGPNSSVGTVIAGMADGTGGSWTGTSGHGDLHPVMAALLDDVQQVEAWPIGVCGEVDAMNQYLRAHNINTIADIPVGGVFSHAETWDAQARKWKGRSACKNCGQWLGRIEAYLA